MITVLGLNSQNRTTGISEIALDMRNMPESEASGTQRQLLRCKAMSGVGGKADLPVERPDFSV
jgi:hypothetical protein